MSFTQITSTSQLDHFLTAYQASGAQLVVRRDKTTNKDILGFTSKLTFGEKFLRLFGAGGSSLKKIAGIEFAKKSACFSLLIEKHNLRTRFGRIDSNTATLYKTDPKFRETFIQAFNRAVVVKNLPKAKLNQLYKLNTKMKEWNEEINATAISAIKQSNSCGRPASLSTSQLRASVTTPTTAAVSDAVNSTLGQIDSSIGRAEAVENQLLEESLVFSQRRSIHEDLPLPPTPDEYADADPMVREEVVETLLELGGQDSIGEIPKPPEGVPEAPEVRAAPRNNKAIGAEGIPEEQVSSQTAQTVTRPTADALQAEIERRKGIAKKNEAAPESAKPNPPIREDRSLGGAMRQSTAFAKAQQLSLDDEKGVEGASKDEWDEEDEVAARDLAKLKSAPPPAKEPLVGEKVSSVDRGKRENLDASALRPKRKITPEEAQRQSVEAEQKRMTKLEALRRANAPEEEEDL